MNTDEILRRCDHTVLNRDATWEDVRKACDQAMRFDTASVCIPPCFVKRAAEYLAGRKAVCTVTGFPNGYSTVAAKAYETRDAVKNGADEIDAVINVCAVKARDRRYLTDEVLALREASKDKILKIIIEICLLTDSEIDEMCDIVTRCGADFIKTSTGFASGGATVEAVRRMREKCGANVKVKAAGGISGFADAVKLLEAGADRLGTSRLVKEAEIMAAAGASPENISARREK